MIRKKQKTKKHICCVLFMYLHYLSKCQSITLLSFQIGKTQFSICVNIYQEVITFILGFIPYYT
jgi:hypothetical protein